MAFPRSRMATAGGLCVVMALAACGGTDAVTAPTTAVAPQLGVAQPEAAPQPTPGGATSAAPRALDLRRLAGHGGPGYYDRFAKAKASGWSEPDLFPISVFLGKPEHAPRLKAAGINTYMGAEHDGSAISTITRHGMYVLAQNEWTTAEIGKDSRVVGWLVSDECDMGLGCPGDNTQKNLAWQKAEAAKLRARKDGRFLLANYGNGVLDTWWAKGTMSQFVRLVDVASVDKYAYTSPHVQDIIPASPHWPKGARVGTSGAYGWLADRLKAYQDPKKQRPYWVFVETAKPYLTEGGATTIPTERIEGAVWSSIIHGATGIAYFQHNNNGTCGNYSIIECGPKRTAAIKAINAKVQSLAKVLNSATYAHDFAAGADTLLKVHDGSAYVFAGIGLKQKPGRKTFTLPAGVTGTTVTVVGENRTLPVSGGKFTDSFAAEHTHHVYRLAL